MRARIECDLYECASDVLWQAHGGGVLCTVADRAGATNLLTLGWLLLGPFYHERPILAIAVTPRRYSWRFLEELPEFVIAVPDAAAPEADLLAEAVGYCGRVSGRDVPDKFAAAGLTPLPAVEVAAPAVAECPLNIECRVYHAVQPPHHLLTPEHRHMPLAEQHTIYFAEVLHCYRWA